MHIFSCRKKVKTILFYQQDHDSKVDTAQNNETVQEPLDNGVPHEATLMIELDVSQEQPKHDAPQTTAPILQSTQPTLNDQNVSTSCESIAKQSAKQRTRSTGVRVKVS